MSDEDFSSLLPESWDFKPIKTMILNDLDATNQSIGLVFYDATERKGVAISTTVFVC